MVEMEDDVFIDLLWERVRDFEPAHYFSDAFWAEAFDRFSAIGWFEPKYNNPSYIVDNIAVNGEIYLKGDCKSNYKAIDEKYGGDIDSWIKANDYEVIDDYVVIKWGL